ncbi:glycoside hydrolase family 95-like protein, partial [Cnuella takakiae]|uniref:glycoside hydrolase family 95-like protein n=1 Tax=Cnuella takakiae TaxID=1302690 RepID=UPI00373FE207
AGPAGKVGGLKAIGGFELVAMEWKEGRLVRAVLRSNLGGNLRLRVPNALKPASGGALKKAAGANPNPFFQVAQVPDPKVSAEAKTGTPELKNTYLYDLPTQKGQLYTLVAL